MKSSAIIEDNENVVMVPLVWLNKKDRIAFLRDGYEIIPIPGYHETQGLRAVKLIGKYSDDNYWIRDFSIQIWEDWKLTAKYAAGVAIPNSTTGIQMFDRLDDDEKIQALKYWWDDSKYVIEYFKDHPDLLKRAKNSLKLDQVYYCFKNKKKWSYLDEIIGDHRK